MSTSKKVSAAPAPYVQQTVNFLHSLFGSYPRNDFAFRLWEGTIWQKENAQPARFTIVLNHPAALRRMFLPPSDTRLANAYMLADFDIEGEAGGALNLGQHLWKSWSWRDLIRSGVQLIMLPSNASAADVSPQLSGAVHSADRDKKAIQYHYDVSNEFYKLWLDERMVYSCAYFKHASDTIDDAQLQKLDHICRKLRLKKGERLLDIGCGWGALVIHAVKNYGVTALGVTVSEKQVELARQRVHAAGISESCEIALLDYRAIDESKAFDKIVSIGMVEHVGRNNLKVYFEKAYRLLRPGGVFLNHGITLLHDTFKTERQMKNGFFAKYIFPDGDIQPLTYILEVATKETKFEIRDVESLREHYAMTLQRWQKRLEKHEEKVVEMMGQRSYRLWRLYLLAAGWGFANGLHSIYQTLLYKGCEEGTSVGTEHSLPLTRADWYA